MDSLKLKMQTTELAYKELIHQKPLNLIHALLIKKGWTKKGIYINTLHAYR